jgi:hypothetical protein
MDDYTLSTIIESKNEWCARLTNTLTPCIIEGLRSVFSEAYNVCKENDEDSKYLMTFQNFLNNIPKWSSEIVENEKQRIITSSACNYLEDLISCVHITQLKSLTSSRVGLKQKKINIDIPDLGKFIHKTYINVARKVYVNIYLFEINIKPLQTQKNNRELELIVKECILNTIRESIPIEHILQMYLDETLETDVEVEEKKEIVTDKEALDKLNKLKATKELEKIKKEALEKIKDESKTNLKKAIKNATKDLNEDNLEISNKNGGSNKNSLVSKLESTSNNDSIDESNDESNNESNDESDREDIYKLKIDKMNINSSELNIKNIKNDPDELNLNIVNLKTELSSDDEKSNVDSDLDLELDLDIEEL